MGQGGVDRSAPPGVEVVGLAQLAAAVSPLGAAQGVVIADAAVAANGYVDRAVDALGACESIDVHVVPGHEPTVASVDAAADLVREHGAGLVVGVGGGSALDTAKQAAAVAAGPHSVAWYTLDAHPLPVGVPVVAVPTTAGTGAEVTRTCVVTSDDGDKSWTWGQALLPRIVVLDPAATATMPPAVTAATGLDAFVHAMEAVTGRRAGRAVAGSAIEALRLVLDHLPAAIADGADLAARDAMQRAAFLAGVAIDTGGTGIAHAIGHALASMAHVPHGLAVAAGLAATMDWNVDGSAEAFGVVADGLDVSVDALADAYRHLLSAVGFASCLARVGPLDIDPVHLAETMDADANRPMLQNNCRFADERDRHALATAALALWNGAAA